MKIIIYTRLPDGQETAHEAATEAEELALAPADETILNIVQVGTPPPSKGG